MSQENVNCSNGIEKFITQNMNLRSEELEKIISPENIRPIRTTKKTTAKKKQQHANKQTKTKQQQQNPKTNFLVAHLSMLALIIFYILL